MKKIKTMPLVSLTTISAEFVHKKDALAWILLRISEGYELKHPVYDTNKHTWGATVAKFVSQKEWK